MSNKIRSITLLFDEDVSEECIDYIEETALCYKSVVKIERDIAGSISEWAIENRINDSWKDKLKELIYATN